MLSQFRILIIIAGLVVGFLIGLTGVGGGVLLTPVLILLSVPPTIAVGTDLFYGSLTKMVGSYQHWKQGSINWKWVLYMAIGSVPSAVVAAYLIHFVSVHYGSADKMVRTGLGVVLVFAAIASLVNEIYRKRAASFQSEVDPSHHKVKVILLGVVVGFLVGLTSVGSGSLIAMALIMFSRLRSTTIVGTDIAHALLLVTAAALAHWQIGTVNVPLAANLLIGSLPGVVIGSRLAYRTPGRPLRYAVALLVLAGGLKML
ncbi:MAG: sulfite exporter TauE/SafE family protein [Acidobacteria bacterium]|nr:sulfite exporter TauE/SafE family protein [Acidobacteriota bacterium]